MSFTVELPNDQLSVEAGATVPAAILIKNTGDSPLQLEVFVEGIDGEWVMVPVPVIAVEPSSQVSEKIFLKPPRTSESLSGTYPFVVKVRSLESGDARSAQGLLDVKPFHYLSLEVSPKKGTFSPSKKDNVFTASVLNLGNSEHTLQLFGNDPEDALSYNFESEQVTIGPGQTKTVEATVVPLSSRTFSSSRLHGFTIGVRSLLTPSAAASANAQLEQRPLITPGGLLAFLAIALLAIAWVLALPKPPNLASLKIAPDRVIEGENVTLKWSAANADVVRVTLNGKPFTESTDLVGELSFKANEGGRIEAVAMRGTKPSAAKQVELIVDPKPVIPEPKIVRFVAGPDPAKVGEKVEIRYQVSSSVTRLVLLPHQENLDPQLNTKLVDATTEGDLKLTLKAYNSEGKTVEETRTVKVVDPTKPKIVRFTADRQTVEIVPTEVMFTWQVENGSSIVIKHGSESVTVFEQSGTRSFTILESTTFTMVVTDAKGRTTQKLLTVTHKPKVDPPPTTTSPTTPSGDQGTPPSTATTGGNR